MNKSRAHRTTSDAGRYGHQLTSSARACFAAGFERIGAAKITSTPNQGSEITNQLSGSCRIAAFGRFVSGMLF
jgi:hypothetical protein